VVGFGGYVSTPAYLAARKLNVPVVVQEQNARAGLANKLGARWAARIATTFPQTRLPGATVTGLPLRADIAALVQERHTDRTGLRKQAATTLGLDPERPVLLITGGSLGALKINQTMAQVARDVLAQDVQVLHLTGRGKSEQVLADIAHLPHHVRADYHVLEYLDQMQLAYAVADLVVCRSGAGTVCELAALGLPAVFVPLPIGNGEQKLNASPLTDAHAALIVDNEAFTPQWASSTIVPLLANRDELARMAQAAASVGRPQATQDVVDIIEQVAGWTRG
jgi:UDP-N-acetylglucosamine:LPS N-acetylglucosamine transferase